MHIYKQRERERERARERERERDSYVSDYLYTISNQTIFTCFETFPPKRAINLPKSSATMYSICGGLFALRAGETRKHTDVANQQSNV